jgi:hypothetical protein
MNWVKTRAPSPSLIATRIPLVAALAVALAGCAEPAPEPAVPSIIQQPANAEVFHGQTAVFEVQASASGLTYQWSRDGVPIPGATESRYTTPPNATEDDGATYRVAVAADGSAPTVSEAARLTVYPPLDLRFQWVGAPITLEYIRLVNLVGWVTTTLEGVGGPLLVGEGICTPSPPIANCSWEIAGHPRIPGFQTIYHAGFLGDFGRDWVNAVPPNALVTSLDLEEGASAFATSVLRTTQTGTFAPILGSVTLDQLPLTAAAEGAQGRVLTAVSFRGGLVTYISYSWSEAPTVRYETRVVTTAIGDAGDAATVLGAEGYVITAFGAGNVGASGVVLVGTRRAGEVAPRAVQVQVATGHLSSPPGYAAVGFFCDLSPFGFFMIFER